MQIDENQFFREATLRICGSLDIEQALWRAFMYIRDYIPADMICLNYFDSDQGVVVVYASATPTGGVCQGLRIPMSPSEQGRLLSAAHFQDVMLFNRLGSNSIVQKFQNAVGLPVASLLSLRMRVEGQVQGNVVLISKGPDDFTREHTRLLNLLNDPFALAFTNSRRFRELAKIKDLLADDNQYLQRELRQLAGDQIVGADTGLRGVMTLVRQVAPQPSPVLVVGETGAGKEVIARAVHELSPRRDGPFIKVNCGAIPQSLMDSELFGHEKGAFTGAINRMRGRFERADQGTILLDEVGELTPEAQVRLLRVLQEKEIERLGGSKPIKLNIRVVAATHRNLADMVKAGVFRQDLYYRLNVFPVHIPPLRQRKDDIEPLVQYFLQCKSREMGRRHLPRLTRVALDILREYDWPGNVRELEHAVERALILGQGQSLDFAEYKTPKARLVPASDAPEPDLTMTLDMVMARHITQVLARTKGRVEGPFGAARVLGLKPGTLRYRMKKLGIPFGHGATGISEA